MCVLMGTLWCAMVQGWEGERTRLQVQICLFFNILARIWEFYIWTRLSKSLWRYICPGGRTEWLLFHSLWLWCTSFKFLDLLYMGIHFIVQDPINVRVSHGHLFSKGICRKHFFGFWAGQPINKEHISSEPGIKWKWIKLTFLSSALSLSTYLGRSSIFIYIHPSVHLFTQLPIWIHVHITYLKIPFSLKTFSSKKCLCSIQHFLFPLRLAHFFPLGHSS